MHPSIASLTFGPEFEVLVPYSLGHRQAATEFTRLTGLPCIAAYRGARAPAGVWKVVHDTSVQPRTPGESDRHGFEFVAPILSGQRGLDEIATATNALRVMGATVNSSCGFHVHVGVNWATLDFWKTLVKLYARYEEAIDSIMPPSRRGNVSAYAKSLKLANPEQLDRATSIEQITRIVHHASGAGMSRFHKINLEAYQKFRTVEFRQHAGTVDTTKAVNWIITCLKLVAAAREGRTGAGPQIARDYSNMAIKTRAVIEMCSRSEGATVQEICARFGFSTVSIKRHARLAGIETRRTGKRFWITAQTDNSPAAVPPTLEGLADLIEADDEHRAFLARRRQDTSGS